MSWQASPDSTRAPDSNANPATTLPGDVCRRRRNGNRGTGENRRGQVKLVQAPAAFDTTLSSPNICGWADKSFRPSG